MKRENIFISYSHKDKPWLEKLKTMLSPLERSGKLLIWDDSKIHTGGMWREQIQKALDSSKAAVLLVTDHFLDSDFIMTVELPSFLKASEKEGMRLFIILITDCLYESTPLGAFQFANNPKVPLSTLTYAKQKTILANIARDLNTSAEANTAHQNTNLDLSQDFRRIEILRLPSTEYKLFGRETELKNLNKAWNNSNVNLVEIVGFGGTGKSALINHWLQNLKERDWGDADRVFGWSFFNQGSSDFGQNSSELFLVEAFKFFGIADQGNISAWEKGRYLANAIRSKRVILILDGVETLQESPGPRGGFIRDQGFLSLVLELANENSGICILTTRIEVEDLRVINPRNLLLISLKQLLRSDGAALLKYLQVKGTKEDLQLASEEFGGHPLAIRLLGNYLVEIHDGDIQKRDQISRLADEERQGHHAHRVMTSYELWFSDKPELKILYLIGLFDRAIEKATFDILLNEPFIKTFVNPLIGINEVKWKFALGRLKKVGLIDENGDQYDCHPLVREHFAARFKETLPDIWSRAHGRLFDYFQQKPNTDRPDSIEDLEPLFQAVYHGCQSGRHLEAFNKIYWERINRKEEVYCTHKLGAVAADLRAIRNFFIVVWTKLNVGFEEHFQAWLFNQAGYDLRAIGQLVESQEPIEAGLKLCVEAKDWRSAARCANNLGRIHLMLGKVLHSQKYAHLAVEYADTSGDYFSKIAYRSNLAYSLHQAGNFNEAKDLFNQVNGFLEEKPLPPTEEIRNNQYWDFLLTESQYNKVIFNAERSLEKKGGRLLNIALDYLSLGRALSMKWELEKNDLSEKEQERLQNQIGEHLNRSVQLCFHAGRQHEIPRVLLARAEFYRKLNDTVNARLDVDNAFKVAARYEMKLHLIDCHLEYLKLDLKEKKDRDAKIHFQTIVTLISETSYRRRESELLEIEKSYVVLAKT